MCGIIGIVSKQGHVISDAIDLLNAENNRGEQACGAAAFDGTRIRCYRGKGLVAKVFDDENYERWSKLVGSTCIAQYPLLHYRKGRRKETTPDVSAPYF
jgi:glutamine phosphoribosylpyrophosphate amidotransferase